MKTETLVIIGGLALVGVVFYVMHKNTQTVTSPAGKTVTSPATGTAGLITAGAGALNTVWGDVASLFGGSATGSATAPTK